MKKSLWIAVLCAAALSAMEPVVSVQWLQKELGKKDLIVVDVSDADFYEDEHIQGALNSPISHWRAHHGDFLLVKEQNAIQKEFEKLGIDASSRVVVYSHHTNPKDTLKASYVLWAMEYYGFKNTAMLDGGLAAYKKAKAQLSAKKEKAAHKGSFRVKKNPALVIDLAGVKRAIGKANMVDARPPTFYFGAQKQGVLAKAGHIPHATSYFWRYSFDGEMLKDKAKLKAMLVDGLGFKKDDAIVTYCTGGLETSMNFFVLHRVLGFTNIKLYDASMREWANEKSTPMTLYKWE